MRAGIPRGAERIVRGLTAAGYEAYLVGGCVRDLLRGFPPQDWDICTSALPRETEECFASWRTVETGLKHGTVTLWDGERAYEVTTYRSDGAYTDGRRPDRVRFVSCLREDLARRDFTMNAMAMDLEGRIQDPFGGAEDIQKGLIRCVGEPEERFREDGLRVLRALRFSAELDYPLEDATARAVHTCRFMLKRVAAERIQAELRRLLTGPGTGRVLRDYRDVLWEFWPELQEGTDWETAARGMGKTPALPVHRLALLLYGIEPVEELLRRLKFDKETCRRVTLLTGYMDRELPAGAPGLRRWLGELGERDLFALLSVREALAQARGEETETVRAAREEAERILSEGECFRLKELAVKGEDILALGVSPGPEVGRLLDRLLDQVREGKLPNRREELLERARELWEGKEGGACGGGSVPM